MADNSGMVAASERIPQYACARSLGTNVGAVTICGTTADAAPRRKAAWHKILVAGEP